MSATVDIWLERMHTRPQVVKCLMFSTFDDHQVQHILSMPWEVLVGHIEDLSTQPKALFLFRSTKIAALFSKHFATVPEMASLRATNRLIYVLEDKDKRLLSVVKEDDDVEWITLGKDTYYMLFTSSLIPDRLTL